MGKIWTGNPSIILGLVWCLSVLFGRGDEVGFKIKLVPIVAAGQWREVHFKDGVVRLEQAGKEAVEIKLGEKAVASLEAAIRKPVKQQWKGFWQSVSIDGQIVTAKLIIGRDLFGFRGLNGCPPGFSAILMEINRVTGREVFRADWKELEEDSFQLKNDPFAKPDAARKELEDLKGKWDLPFTKGN